MYFKNNDISNILRSNIVDVPLKEARVKQLKIKLIGV